MNKQIVIKKCSHEKITYLTCFKQINPEIANIYIKFKLVKFDSFDLNKLAMTILPTVDSQMSGLDISVSVILI